MSSRSLPASMANSAPHGTALLPIATTSADKPGGSMSSASYTAFKIETRPISSEVNRTT